MTPHEYYLYVLTHVVFNVMGLLLVCGACPQPIPWTASTETFVGMNFISEEIMICKYTKTPWQYLPQMISIALSLVYIQIYHTYRILTAANVTSSGPIALVVILATGIHGFLVIISYDYRTTHQIRETNEKYHFYGVGLFGTSFWFAHLLVCISYARRGATINGVYYAKVRRRAYWCVDIVYFCSTIAFALAIIGNWKKHAIAAEYVLLFLGTSMNLYSMYILGRFI